MRVLVAAHVCQFLRDWRQRSSWELAVYGGNLNNDRVVNAGEQLRSDLVQLIERAGATRLLLIVVTAIVLVCVDLLFRQRRRTPAMADPDG